MIFKWANTGNKWIWYPGIDMNRPRIEAVESILNKLPQEYLVMLNLEMLSNTPLIHIHKKSIDKRSNFK